MASHSLPGVTTLKIPGRKVRHQDAPYVKGGDVVLKSTVVDTGNGLARTTLIRSGVVVVKKTADGLYYLADDASNGDRNTAPSITSAGHTDGNGVIKLVGNHGTISVTTATGSGTEANNATDLNADAVFRAHYVASVSGTDLKIEARDAGAQEWFYVHADTMASAAFAEGLANAVKGTFADYRVLEGGGLAADMLGQDGVVRDTPAPSVLVAYFIESQLLNLTPEAKAVLASRGSLFG